MIHLRTLNIKIIASILLFTCGILFFSLAVQKYQVITSSQATLNLPVCEIPENGTIPTNAPCASCTIDTETTIEADGNATVQFSCQVACNDSDNPLDTTGCPSGALPYSISETSWYWCRAAGDHSCTDQNELTGDLITSVESSAFTDGGPWIMSRQGETTFDASFAIPGYETCGRVQVEVETNQKYSYVVNADVDCDDSVIGQDLSFNDQPTPTFGFGFPSDSPSNTPPVPTHSIAPTKTPTQTPTLTPTSKPTNTPTLSPTNRPSGTITPSLSVTPTGTLTPAVTGSLTPTLSLTASPSATLIPTATLTPTLTPTFTPTLTPTFTLTPTPPQDITVNGEAPGITNWLMMLVPVGLVMLGLLL